MTNAVKWKGRFYDELRFVVNEAMDLALTEVLETGHLVPRLCYWTSHQRCSVPLRLIDLILAGRDKSGEGRIARSKQYGCEFFFMAMMVAEANERHESLADEGRTWPEPMISTLREIKPKHFVVVHLGRNEVLAGQTVGEEVLVVRAINPLRTLVWTRSIRREPGKKIELGPFRDYDSLRDQLLEGIWDKVYAPNLS